MQVLMLALGKGGTILLLISEETTDHKTLNEYIEDFCYDLLADNHGGWEINEGQNGNITWNSKNNKIEHQYFTMIEYEHGEDF